jgi:hypothetical protein
MEFKDLIKQFESLEDKQLQEFYTTLKDVLVKMVMIGDTEELLNQFAAVKHILHERGLLEDGEAQ